MTTTLEPKKTNLLIRITGLICFELVKLISQPPVGASITYSLFFLLMSFLCFKNGT